MKATSQFKPAWWLRNAHLQTLWPSLFRRPVTIDLNTERLDLPDGDFVDLAWTKEPSQHIVIIFHGLEGSIDSSYAKGILSTIQSNAWQGVFMHFRGCSGEPNLKDRAYHSGETGDIRFLIETLRNRFPNKTLSAVGYSLGANALLKYLGEYKENSQLTAAVAISVPYLLSSSAKKLGKGLSKIYQHHLVSRLIKKTEIKFKDRQAPFDISQLKSWNTFHLFDHHITAPLHGFKGSDDYYEKCSSRQFLKTISTPTLLIHAKDDPFMYESDIPSNEELSDTTTLEVSECGGHVGFISGSFPWNANYWLEQRVPQFLARYLN